MIQPRQAKGLLIRTYRNLYITVFVSRNPVSVITSDEREPLSLQYVFDFDIDTYNDEYYKLWYTDTSARY